MRSARNMEKVKILLGDPRHKTVGLHSVYVPLGIGFIGSYALSQFGEGSVDVRLLTDPDEIINDVEEWHPHIVGVSNYLWNSNLSNRLCEITKEIDPGIITVSGGPQFPIINNERNEYLYKRPDIDFYIYEDGELAFSKLLRKLIELQFDIKKVRSIYNEGIISLKPKSKEMLICDPIKRFTNMDKIPSPYLSGLFDKFLLANFMPALETTRGCPYTCTYCHTGNRHEVRTFSVQRVKEELDYILENTDNCENKGLCLFNANFGLLKEDNEIAEYLAYLRTKTGWPMIIEGGGTVKKGGNVYIPDYAIYESKNMGWSFQTLNQDTLNVIKRKNPSKQRIKEIANKLLENQNTIPCELIAPLPLETKDSYFQAQKFLIENGFSTQTYTTMLLYGTPLASEKSRNKYQFITKYRVVPRQFGEYKSKKILEIEEVCISTNTFSFKDNTDIRGFSLIIRIFTLEQFNHMQKHLRDFNLSFFEFIYAIWSEVKNDKGELSDLYNDFLNEVEDELFDTEDELITHFTKEKNYDLLLNLTTSDNLIRKYTVKAYFLGWEMLLDFSYSILKKMKKLSKEQIESLDAAKKWALTLRNVTNVFDSQRRDELHMTLRLPYDVLKWSQELEEKALHMYKVQTTYNIFYGKKYLEMVKFIEGSSKQCEGNNEFVFGNLVTRGFNLSDLWLQCESA